MTVRRIAAALSCALIAAVLLAAPITSATADSPSACTAQFSSLKEAGSSVGDLDPVGQPVTETTLDDSTSIPVIAVHGWTSNSIHDEKRGGAFSRVVDLTANKGQSVALNRSIIGVIQQAGGATVYTFDYHDISSRWVTDAGIGQQLSEAITCLATAHGHPALLVTHSMGGLASRQALGLIASSGQDPSEFVSDVVTYGTPNTGSWVASVVGGIDAGVALTSGPSTNGALTGAALNSIRALITACGLATSQSMSAGGFCGALPPPVAAARSEASKALQIGSPQIGALPAWPAAVKVHSFAGSAEIEVKRYQWFGTSIPVGVANVGDFVVSSESALAGATDSYDVSCAYTMDAKAATTDNLLEAWKIKPAGDTRDYAVSAYLGGSSVCFHDNLMRSVEFSNVVLGVVADLVDEANAALGAWEISFDGIGPIEIGVTSWEGATAVPGFEDSIFEAPDFVCAVGGWSGTDGDYDGLTVLTDAEGSEPGAIEVVGVSSFTRTGAAAAIKVETADGIGLGSSEAEVRAAYPNATEGPFELSEHYTVFRVENGTGRGMSIKTSDGVVADIAVGAVPEVFYLEGCA